MSHWDHKQGVVVSWKPHPVDEHPGWWATDCGCSSGLQWGGESPRDCESCMGGGVRYIHLATRTVAAWPGGPLLGAKASHYEMRPILEAHRFEINIRSSGMPDCPYPNSLGGHTFETTPPREAVCVQCGVVFVPSYVPDDNPQEES